MNLDLKHLEMIHTLAHSDTVKAAADKLFISQPALSSRIKEAERRLGTPLFVRHGRKLVMSSAGKRLLHSAERVLKELERVEYDIGLLSEGGQQVVRLGLPYLAPRHWLADIYQRMATDCPQLALEVVPVRQEPLQALRQGEVDIALTVRAQPRESDGGLCHQGLFADQLMAVVPADHPLAHKPALVPEDFTALPYITNAAIPERDREHALYFLPNQCAPKRVLQVGYLDVILEMVAQGMGVSILSHWLLASRPDPRLAVRPLSPAPRALHWDLWHQDQPGIAPCAALLAERLSE
ncbi:LysR family transcriptional regulator [Ferrimonas balearica]|uniref:LysR family transcriptional regulator n=1 Tax=Ferrimonas balearica TaxID=44012 RepID=UPI001C9A1975|nr:LysR family transcriptional regulator [Ferrimonas balearica]MBY5990887.1 LysR family transcriptional regulator [Ferrimonas balearica]